MRFEHLVEVNDLDNPLHFALDRGQIWAGLMARVEDSVPFLPGLAECRILSREAGAVERLLVFGSAQVRDRASYLEAQWVCFETARTEQHAGGSLTIRIEEPEEGRLFLRFTYETSFAEPGDDPEARAYVDYLKSAYHAADLDTVALIRELAQSRSAH